MKLTALKAATLAAILPVAAQAGVTITPMATYANYDDVAKGTVVPQLGLGYRFNNLPLAVEVVGGMTKTDFERGKFNRFTNPTLEGSDANLPEAEIRQIRADAKFFLPLNLGSVEPYVAAGVGGIEIKGGEAGSVEAVYGDKKGEYLTGNAGGGLLIGLTDHLKAVADARYIGWRMGNVYQDDGNAVNDYRASLGLQYDFGSKAAPVAVPVPVVKPETPDVIIETPKAPTKRLVDSDGDGVYDNVDKCPGTPRNFKVDASGCPIEIVRPVSIPLRVLFDTNKAHVKPVYLNEIRKVANFMNQFPNSTTVVEGHTDSRGRAKYNQRLSQRRANAVKAAIVKQGINPARLRAVGYGEGKPVATNATEAGRQQNRRVVAVVSGKKQVTLTK